MKRFNPAISFIRVIAMISIILEHICTEYKINTYQFGGMFLTGPMKVMDWFDSVPQQLVMFGVFTALTAIIITLLNERKSLFEIIKNQEARGNKL